MCGIIGYVGEREAKPLLLQGLKRLEYRGYDSAGIALREDDRLDYVRAVGNLENLIAAAGPNGSTSRHGLGHTRWATHGGVTEQNAHPLVGCDSAKLAIVLNGIVENYRELKAEVERELEEIQWDQEVAEKGGFETFMLKEIYEQPEAVAETIGDRVRGHNLVLDALAMTELEVQNLRRVVIVACGTAYHAAVVGRYVIEEWARVPGEADIASQWIYRNPVLSKDTLVIGISQSGETRDTVNAMKLARERGARTLAITNLMGTQITLEVESVLYTRCGLEIGVAASKTFTAQVALLCLIALKMAQIRKTLPADEIDFILDRLHELPEKIQTFLDDVDAGRHRIEEIAQRFYEKPFFLYLGRHIGLPVALEGALKLKEISYIPTDAYSAGEMKHGPIALLDEGTPVVVVATNIHVYDKIVSNIQETRARGAHVIAIATDGNEDIQHHADDVIYVPESPAFLQAALAILPLQLLAYRIARLRGLNVDQPRNLAKTVTVE